MMQRKYNRVSVPTGPGGRGVNHDNEDYQETLPGEIALEPRH